MTGPRRVYRWRCPDCGAEVVGSAQWQARQRLSCRPCIRTRTGWSCPGCGATDPRHPYPCLEAHR